MSKLRELTEVMASLIAKLKVDIRKILTNTYLRGTTNKEDYGALAYTGDLPFRTPQSYDESLDKIGDIFDVKRNYKESDESYRQRIIFNIKRSTTNKGIEETVKFIFESSAFFNLKSKRTNFQFDIKVLENYNNSFDGVNFALNTPVRGEMSRYYGIIIYITPRAISEINGVRKSFLSSYDFHELINNSDYSGLREMMSFLVASGIKVDRVIVQQPGAGGNKGEIYAYS